MLLTDICGFVFRQNFCPVIIKAKLRGDAGGNPSVIPCQHDYIVDSFPAQWLDIVLACVLEEGRPGVSRPRPKEYWPVDFMPLAEKLLG